MDSGRSGEMTGDEGRDQVGKGFKPCQGLQHLS
jgi:hypothetical protein